MKKKKNLIALGFGLVISILLAEAIFRINGRYYTYSERMGKGYITIYTPDKKSWLTTQPANFDVIVSTPDFKYVYKTNSMGFCDKEFNKEKSEGVKRIIAFGDSFTEGTGAPQDSSWPKQLENKLNHDGFKYEVWNCGISSSDPVNSFLLLKFNLREYNPDMVLVAINKSDLDEIAAREGFERLHYLHNEDSIARYSPPPWFEPVYARSHIARHVFHDVLKYDWLLQSRELAERNNKKSIETLKSSTDSLASICSGKASLIFIFHPLNYEITDNAFYCEEVFKHCIEKNYEVVNLFDHFRKHHINKSNLYRIYWKADKHNNTLGYSMFADAIAEEINSRR